MKPNETKDPGLSRLLQEWKLESALSPGFKSNVWRTLERSQVPSSRSVMAMFLEWVEPLVARPALAFSYIAVLTMLGAGTGYFSAAKSQKSSLKEMKSRYVQVIDPYRAFR